MNSSETPSERIAALESENARLRQQLTTMQQLIDARVEEQLTVSKQQLRTEFEASATNKAIEMMARVGQRPLAVEGVIADGDSRTTGATGLAHTQAVLRKQREDRERQKRQIF